jgi:hypothetical protein
MPAKKAADATEMIGVAMASMRELQFGVQEDAFWPTNDR